MPYLIQTPGTYIRDLRLSLGFTRDALAAEVGVDKTSVADVEASRKCRPATVNRYLGGLTRLVARRADEQRQAEAARLLETLADIDISTV